MISSYVPLHVHTTYSLAESTIKVKALAKHCKKLGIPAVAMTDTHSMAGTIEFCKYLSEEGIQPIVGVHLDIEYPIENDKTEHSPILLLAKNKTGYLDLIKIVSEACLRTDCEKPKLLLSSLKNHKRDNIILLTGGYFGPIQQALLQNKKDIALTRLKTLKKLFTETYLQISRLGYLRERDIEKDLLDLSEKTQTPLVATNETFFLDPSLHEAHDVLLCIAGKNKIMEQDRRRVPESCYLKSPEDMNRLFEDLPDALENTKIIAQKCSYLFENSKPMLPPFPGLTDTTEEEEIQKQAHSGLDKRLLETKIPENLHQEYKDRLNYELSIIIKMGFPGYFLIVSDFIKWAKSKRIPVGPGRGSGAGSLVAYCLEITNIDPLRYGLLFERFLNPDRVSMPDFDIDFCQERRGEVIQYVKHHYGENRVCQIGTFGKLQARAVVKDVGRVLQIPYSVVDRYTRMIPNNPAHPVTLEQAMELDPLKEELEKAESDIKRLFTIALQLEGLFRHSSTHAAGIIISDKSVEDVVPLLRDPEGAIVSQFDMKSVELAGLVKFDFLGLKTLDVIQGTLDILEQKNIHVNFTDIGTEDQKTYSMLAEGNSFGVFQLESAGMKNALKTIKPTLIDDLVALVSLYRPGPMAEIPKYAAVKNNINPPDYSHDHEGVKKHFSENAIELIKPILEPTYGVIIYQEQVMQLARTLADYSLGQADLLRRAMGKKIKEEMDKHRVIFQEGAKKKNVDTETAFLIFEKIYKFADYGFNKSHAAAYAVISFHTAYLKANYPHEFFAASMNLDLDKVEKLSDFQQELKQEKIKILPPNINTSEPKFSVIVQNGEKCILYALSAIRGVGLSAMKDLLEDRKKNGPYSSLNALVKRTSSFLNKKGYESLIKSGALDTLHNNRKSMIVSLEKIMKREQTESKRKTLGQISIFDSLISLDETKLEETDQYTFLEQMQEEYTSLGLYLSGHPLQNAEKRLTLAKAKKLSSIFNPENSFDHPVKFGAIVLKITVKTTKKQEPMGILMISDPSYQTEIALFGETFHTYRNSLQEEKAYLFTATVKETEEGDKRIFVKEIEELPLEKHFDEKEKLSHPKK